MSAGRYKDAGVDIDAGNALVAAIAPLAQTTARSGVVSDLGGFGALFDPRAAGYADPLLVAATDGVGTKLKIASATGRYDRIGIDLVAMCVNDLVVQGAEPLFFLDYLATGRLGVGQASAIVAGIADGCRHSGCALIGGETAEMPGLYADGEFDLAGFAVGAVERTRVLTGADAIAGDVLLGLASSGLHSNGFSLVRRIVADAGLDHAGAAPFAADRSLAEALLTPTRLYVRSCLAAADAGGLKALAHVTGGGLIDNLPRVLPDRVTAEIDTAAWPIPPVFRWLATAGGVPGGEMFRTFNCGIGMVAVVAADRVRPVRSAFERNGETVYTLGRLIERPEGGAPVVLEGAEGVWQS